MTLPGADAKAHGKRPDVVLYVNGIALGVLELKRSTVSVAEGIRQNLDNQKKTFIQPFFSTMQLVMAGNDTEGLRYGMIETQEKYYLTWKEDSTVENPLDRALTQLCAKTRFLEMIHDFVVFDAGTKKTLPPQPVFRCQGSPGVREAPRRRHHLAHPGQRQKPDHGLACQVDPGARHRFPRPDHHRPHRTGRADRESLPGVK